MKLIVFTASLLGLVGCQTTSYTPMELALNKAAGSDVIKQNCHVSYQTAEKLKSDKDRNLLTAKEMGATKSDYKAAYDRVNTVAVRSIIFVGETETCKSLISELAWENSESAVELPD